jgi:hypothetical protein
MSAPVRSGASRSLARGTRARDGQTGRSADCIGGCFARRDNPAALRSRRRGTIRHWALLLGVLQRETARRQRIQSSRLVSSGLAPFSHDIRRLPASRRADSRHILGATSRQTIAVASADDPLVLVSPESSSLLATRKLLAVTKYQPRWATATG